MAKHTLVIGGTGMLGGAVKQLAESGNQVSVIAPDTDKIYKNDRQP